MVSVSLCGQLQNMWTCSSSRLHDPDRGIPCVCNNKPLQAFTCAVQGLIYFYESIADAKAEVTQADSHSTILQAMQAALQDGKSVIADVDVAAVRALRALNVPGCYVFVLPASMQALQQNIAASLQDPAEGEIERTVAVSEKEILSVDEAGLYDYSIQNDDTSAALREFANLARQHGLVAAEVSFSPFLCLYRLDEYTSSRLS